MTVWGGNTEAMTRHSVIAGVAVGKEAPPALDQQDVGQEPANALVQL